MPNTTFDRPDLSTFTHLDDLGLEVTGQRIEPDHAVLACRIVGEDRWCRRCGCQGEARDTVVRRLAHEPYGWRPTILHVSVRRYRCPECAHVWRQDMSQAADPRAKLSRAAVRWALTGLVVHHLTVARIAQALGVSWNTANTAVLAEGERALINDPTRCEGVRVIGVDEHVWRHTPYGDKYVTVILDLTPIRDRRGPSRLLDMVPGRSKKVFKTWLASQPDTWRERIEIVAMDGFTGFKSAAAEELPDARAVMDPFHVVHLAGNALDECRRRIQQELHHRRGRATDPLYKARRMLHTRSCLLTARQQHQILDLFSNDEHVALEVTWSVYQNIIDAYRSSNARGGKTLMHEEIARLNSTGMPSSLTELTTLGRTLKRRATDILAYFDNPHTSNGPTEAINAPPRTPTRLRPRIPKPHPLHHSSTPRNRRIQTPTTPPIMKSLITVALPRHQYESRHNANVCIKGLCPRFSSEHCKTFAPRLRLHVRKLYTTVACAYGIQTLALCCLRLFVHPVLARTTSSVSTLRRTGGMFRPLARVIAISTASAARREGEGSIDVSASAREEASAELSQPMTSTSRPGTKPSFRSARIAPCAHWSL